MDISESAKEVFWMYENFGDYNIGEKAALILAAPVLMPILLCVAGFVEAFKQLFENK